MKKYLNTVLRAVVFTVVMLVLCSFLYPLALTGISQLTMKDKANGSMIDADGNLTSDASKAVGSALIGQDFTEDVFFKGRVSSINYNTYTEEQKESGDYGGVASGSFNYGNSNEELTKRVESDMEEFLKQNPDVKEEDIPADLLTASGSGLDPHISPKAASVQVAAIVSNSGLSQEKVEEIVEKNTQHKVLGVFGQERVNVLKCNLDIAHELGMI